MEIKNLITFVQVAEVGSFTKAANLLGYSQSTVSFQIKQLETELNCLLFERINHSLSLTQRGRELLQYAQKVTRMTDEFLHSTEEGSDITGEVHLLAPDSVSEVMLLENYKRFSEQYPGIRLKFTIAGTEDMLRILDRNEADVMITLDSHIYQKDYIIVKEERKPVHFVASANSPLAGKKNLSIRDLLKTPIILTEKNMGYRHVLDEYLANMSLELHPTLVIGRTDVITKLVEQGCAISFLPDFVTHEKVEEGTIVHLDVTDVDVEIWQQLLYHKNKWISKSLAAFIEFVSQHEFSV